MCVVFRAGIESFRACAHFPSLPEHQGFVALCRVDVFLSQLPGAWGSAKKCPSVVLFALKQRCRVFCHFGAADFVDNDDDDDDDDSTTVLHACKNKYCKESALLVPVCWFASLHSSASCRWRRRLPTGQRR